MTDSIAVPARVPFSLSEQDDPIDQLVAIMERLRHPEKGCPWDIEQTFATIARHTLEEAYEVVDAIERNDMDSLKDELGDLLLQVVFHSRMAEEDGLFDIRDVARGCSDKLLRRHPHIFGTVSVADASEQTALWEAIKASEREKKERGSGTLDGLTVALPALTRAFKLQGRAARVGFDWAEATDVLDKVLEEAEEVRTELTATPSVADRLEDEIGDLLFTVVNLARKANIDPETALRRANKKFERRFRRVEDLLQAEGRHPEDASLDEMEAHWQTAKKEDHDGMLG